MEERIRQARENYLECWEIFSKTGDIQDARLLIHYFFEYDKLLSQEVTMEM